MEILLYTTVLVLCSIHLLRIAIFLIASDVRGVHHFRNHMKLKRSRVAHPLLSIVVLTHDDARTIGTVIDSVFASTYPNLEVIVADFGSKDRTRSLVRHAIKASYRTRLKLVCFSKARKNTEQINTVLADHTRGSLLMLLEPTHALDADALSNAAAHFQSDRRLAALVSNTKLQGELPKVKESVQKFETLFGNKIKRSLSLLNIEYSLNGMNVTFRRSYLKRIGYFNDANDDRERIIRSFDRMCRFDCRIEYGYDVYAISSITPDLKDRIARRLHYKYGRKQASFKTVPAFLPQRGKRARTLNWLRTPYTVYSDILLTIEPVFALFFLINVALLFQPQIVFAAVLALTFYVSFILMISNREDLSFPLKLYVLLFAPFSWLFFYVIIMLDYRALILHLKEMRTPAQTVLYD